MRRVLPESLLGGSREEGCLTPSAFIFSCFHLSPSCQCFSSSLDDSVSFKSRGFAPDFLLPGFAPDFLLPAPRATPGSCPPREGGGSGLSLMPPGEDGLTPKAQRLRPHGSILRHCLRTGVLISREINSVYRGSELAPPKRRSTEGSSGLFVMLGVGGASNRHLVLLLREELCSVRSGVSQNHRKSF